ncbi:MAG TPA: alpha/beta hydrolase [Thermomicrobiaceae bacterium]|nr:alpha/beta hydrolase [Thermomicrobiaceae bacterium]
MGVGIARVSGTDIAYDDVGEGPAVVLNHAYGADMTLWNEQMGPLSQEHRVVRFDAPAHGRSSVPTGPYSYDEVLIGLLDDRGIDRAHLVGLSMGGRVVVNVALAHPERVRSLVLLGAALAGHPTRPDFLPTKGAVVAATQRGDLETARSRFLEDPLFDGTRRHPEAMARVAAIYRRFSFWSWASGVPERQPEPPAIERLGCITCPTLVIVGDLDVPNILEIAGILEAEIPNARRATLPGVGHFAPLEAPDAVNALIQEFLREQGAPGV